MTYSAALLRLGYGLLLNALVAIGVFRLLAAAVPATGGPGGGSARGASSAGRWIAALVLAVSFIVALVTTGGALGVLNRRAAMLGLAALFALAVELALLRLRSRRGAPSVDSAPETAPSLLAALRGDPWIRLCSLLVLAAWIPLACGRLTLPPVSWDALTYHLGFPALWLQTGHLTTSVAAVGDTAHTFYPLAGEMLLYWGILSTGTDLGSCLSQVPFAAASAAIVALLATRTGATPRLALASALCWLGTPGVLRQSVEVMVDLEQAFYLLGTIYFFVRWRDERRTAWLLLGACTAGLLVGTKYSGAVFLVAAVPGLFWPGAIGSPGGPRRRLGAGAVAACVFLVLGLGGYAYARNLVASGNPVLPLEIRFGGHTLFRGPAALHEYFGEGAPRLGWSTFLASARSILEMGPAFPVLLLVFPAGLLAVPGRARGGREVLALVVAVGMLTFLVGAAALPFREHRYFYAVVALAWCAAGALARGDGAQRYAAWVVPILLIVQMPVTLFYWLKDLRVAGPQPGHLLAAAGLSLAAALLFLLSRSGGAVAVIRRPTGGKPGRALGASALGIGLLLMAAGVVSVYDRARFDLWFRFWSSRYEWEDLRSPRPDLRDMADSWRWMASQVDVLPGAIAYAGVNLPYPLTGPGLSRRVVFVPRNGNAGACCYDWGDRPPDPYSGPNLRDWGANVGSMGVAYLCVYRQSRENDPAARFPVERDWADMSPGRFTLVKSWPWARIYRVHR